MKGLCERDLSKECDEKYRNCTDCVLDKITAEIAILNPVDYVSMSSYEGHRGASDMKHDVFQIIDKYKK